MIKGKMKTNVSLSNYVLKRNGVPLGDGRSMRNMLFRSLGAKSFPVFWHYWNPIWGYYLSRYVMRPIGTYLPVSLAIIITFLVSGALHDLAVSLVKWQFVFFFTPFFVLMGLFVVMSNKLNISYARYPWGIRAFINAFFIGLSLSIVYFIDIN